MNKVFVDVGITLDGYIAGLNGGTNNPLGDGGLDIHQWVFKQKSFRKMLKLSEDGETGTDNEIVNATFSRIGANIMGKNMFVEGEANWPEEAPFHTPVYVLTNEKRESWIRPGGTTFYFTNENIESVLQQAKKSAGDKDVRISGGANVIQQYLNAGLTDEVILHIAPFILGKGVSLFENINKRKFALEIDNVINSPKVTHIFYKVINNKK